MMRDSSVQNFDPGTYYEFIEKNKHSLGTFDGYKYSCYYFLNALNKNSYGFHIEQLMNL